MDMVGWVGQGWRWWMICMRGKNFMSGDASALPECEVIH